MHRYFGDNFAVDDAMVDARVLGSPQGAPGEERRLQFRDGMISRENAWQDETAIQRQLAS